MRIALFLISLLLIVNGGNASAACPPDKPIPLFNTCFPCDEPNAILVSIELKLNDFTGRLEEVMPEQKCSNRQIVRTGRTLHNVLKHCPADKPFRNVLGGCYNCDTSEGVLVKAGDKSCPNRVVRETSNANEEMTFLPCPADKPLQVQSLCYACEDEEAISLHPSDIDESVKSCPNRKVIRHYIYPYSVLKQYDGITNEKVPFKCDDEQRDIYIVSDKSETRYGSFYKNPCKNRQMIVQGNNMFLRLLDDASKQELTQQEVSDIQAVIDEKTEVAQVEEQQNPSVREDAKVVVTLKEKMFQRIVPEKKQFSNREKHGSRYHQQNIGADNRILNVAADCTQKDYETGWCSLCQKGFFSQKDGVFLSRADENGTCLSCQIEEEIFLKDEESVRIMEGICPHRLTYQYGTLGKYSVPDTQKWKSKYIFCGWGMFCKPEKTDK